MVTRIAIFALFLPLPMSGQATPDPEPDPPAAAPSSSRVILPALFRTPETGVGGGVVLGWYPGGGFGSRPTQYILAVTLTQEGQKVLEFYPEIYLARGTVRVDAELRAQDYPDAFWGVGSGALESAREDFTARTFMADVTLEREMRQNLWAGIRLMARDDEITETDPSRLLEQGGVTGAGGGTLVGLGGGIRLDTRDSPLATGTGSFLQGDWTVYAAALGSDFPVREFRLDARFFRSAGPLVLAVQGVARHSDGTVPFLLLPRLGGSGILRGYREGRFRDRRLAAVQGEVRTHLFWRLDGAAFAAVGDVAEEWSGFRGPGDLERAAGLGLRFRLNDAGVRVRADYAVGREGGSFYLTIGEAF